MGLMRAEGLKTCTYLILNALLILDYSAKGFCVMMHPSLHEKTLRRLLLAHMDRLGVQHVRTRIFRE